MINITIDCPSKDHRLKVNPTYVVDSTLESHSENLPDPTESSCYEPAFIIGKDITLNQGKTFAECGIEHGDTLYHLLGMKKYIRIRNEFTHQKKFRIGPIHFSCTVGELIDGLHYAKEFCVGQLPATELALCLNEYEGLDKSKTLADYNIKYDDELCLCENDIEISIGVPEYAKMERVLFKPGMTIGNVKDEVKEMMPDVDNTAGLREVYPVGLRGALKDTKGATFFLYLNLFCEEMYLILLKQDAHRFYYGCYLDSEYTVDDICRIIRRDYRPHYRLIRTAQTKAFPKGYSFDHAWMRTFAPQIQAESLSPNMSLPLFFFPLRTKIMPFQLVSASLRSDVGKFVKFFCKKRLCLKGVKRSIYHPPDNIFLKRNRFLSTCHETLSSDSVMITKLCDKTRTTSKRSAYMTVLVRWRTGISSVPIHIKPTVTINVLRDEIESALEVPFLMQKLIFNGKLLQNGNCTLSDEGIENDSIVDLEPETNFQWVPLPPEI